MYWTKVTEIETLNESVPESCTVCSIVVGSAKTESCFFWRWLTDLFNGSSSILRKFEIEAHLRHFVPCLGQSCFDGLPEVRHVARPGPAVEVGVSPDESSGRWPNILLGVLKARRPGMRVAVLQWKFGILSRLFTSRESAWSWDGLKCWCSFS